ncbi:MAG: hypothetical protein HN509_05075 [Halobacteriovoraceae bacterium]|jgi:hypothetical protein|nr:hypothetical protein [Halobacteriovoraceae bacterium]MBT5092760.1 hypothetical protein [Halobacteriovoraceae bacterium]
MIRTTLSLWLVLFLMPLSSYADSSRVDIWPSIPFLRGADLCKYSNAYGQTRSEYMREMVQNAENLLYAGALGTEAQQLLLMFDSLYDKNQRLAVQGKGLDVTLESTLKSYLDSYHRKLRPRIKKISFRHTNRLVDIISALKNGQRIGTITEEMLNDLDFIAYGTYTLAPNCRGNIQVTLHLIGRDGVTDSYVATGKPEVVMSQIASDLYTEYQRTKFPSKLRIGNRNLTLLGGLNGSVDQVSDLRMAELACQTLDGRLPNATELDLISSYGDWSGGVGVGNSVWALPYGKVFHPLLRNPSPVRSPWEVNAKVFKYYCVR